MIQAPWPAPFLPKARVFAFLGLAAVGGARMVAAWTAWPAWFAAAFAAEFPAGGLVFISL